MKKLVSSFLVVLILLVGSIPAFAIEKADLDEYVNQLGITVEDLEDYLSYDGYTLDEFATIEELEDYVGEPVTEETLQRLIENYGMTEQELIDLLIEYGELEEGENIKDVFVYIYDVESIILLDTAEDEMLTLFSELGLTEEEVVILFEHLETVITDDSVEEQLFALADRMIAFEEFESVDELTADQIAEVLSVFDELQQLLQVDVKYYFVKDGVKSAIDLTSLLEMKNPEQGTSLLIEVYDLNGNFLLDALFTAEMIGSDLITETGKDIKESKDVVEVVKTVDAKQTAKGAKLPKTAGHYPEMIFGGLVLIGLAVFLKRKIGNIA
ncbi:MAG: processed acidic surface protein [Bacillota bacterium]